MVYRKWCHEYEITATESYIHPWRPIDTRLRTTVVCFVAFLPENYTFDTPYLRAQNTRRHAALCRAAAVTCREALKICERCAARLAAMP